MARIDFERLSPCGTGPELGAGVPEPERVTLLDLVTAVAEFAASDAEVIAVLQHLIGTGRIQLVGEFREADLALD